LTSSQKEGYYANEELSLTKSAMNTAEHRAVEDPHAHSAEELRQQLQKELGPEKVIPKDWSAEKIKEILNLRISVREQLKFDNSAERACDTYIADMLNRT
jgi:hypothetical protein